MKNNILLKLLAVCLCISSVALPPKLSAEEKLKFRLIHVADLSALLKADPSKVHVYDANNSDTRNKYGVIPGAILLDSYRNYNVATTLPSDKSEKLVFYCANQNCLASHSAAEVALDAGYSDVSVMADGIQGWKDSGQQVQTLDSGKV